MNFLTWIKDLLLGSFTSVAEHFVELYNDALDAGLDPDWFFIAKITILVLFLLGSAFFAGTIAEVKNRNRLFHFVGGLLLPWIYPFIILFKIDMKAVRKEEGKEKEELELGENAGPLEIPESKLGIDNDGGTPDESVEQISQDFIKKISTDDAGNSCGPFMFVFDDGNVIEVQKIVNALPGHAVVEVIERCQAKTLRFPYAKLKSVVRKEHWDPNNIPRMSKPELPKRDVNQQKKSGGLNVEPTIVSKLRQLSKEERNKGNPEETAKLTMEMMSKSTHIGSYVILKPGTEIGGCRIISEIGKGGMGMVYLARHTRLDVNVAVKVISAKCEDEDDLKISQRFLQEAKIAAKIRHPHLVAVMDAGKDDTNELFYIVMEYMDGGTVGDMIQNNGRLNQVDALNIILSVAEALSAGQKFNIVHRDIKPDNIMLTSEGDIKLSDLGLAKVNEPRMELHLTGVNMVLGSIPYMSPEQAKDFSNADFRSDVYSMGASFYQMLTGDFPYKADNPLALMMKAINDPIPNPKNITPELDDEVAAVCMKMMAKSPEDRFQSPEGLISELMRISQKIST